MPQISIKHPLKKYLKGEPVPQDKHKVVKTPSHLLELAQPLIDAKTYWPSLQMRPRQFEDPKQHKPKLQIKASHIANAENFSRALKEEIEKQKDYLIPNQTELFDKVSEDKKTLYFCNYISGNRIQHFFEDIKQLLSTCQLDQVNMEKARKYLNIAYRDLFRRKIEFDKADTQTYWSYSNDHAFVHIYEKLLLYTPKEDPKRKLLQAQIDYILTHFYAPKGFVDERDVETSLELKAIDAQSRHVVSMDPKTFHQEKPDYVVFQVSPTLHGPHAGKYVYMDNEVYYFEDTQKPLDEKSVSSLIKIPVQKVVFRRLIDNEKPRQNFRFDWDGNQLINPDKTPTQWYGYCDIKALMESILVDMKPLKKLVEYRSDTEQTLELDRGDLLEALASFLSFGNQYVPLDAKAPYADHIQVEGIYESGGGRFDDQPSQMVFEVGNQLYTFDIHLRTLSLPEKSGLRVDLDKAFCTKIVDDKMESFTNNPDLVKVENLDTCFLDATQRCIRANVKGFGFDEKGELATLKPSLTLLGNTQQENLPILIASQLVDVAKKTTLKTFFHPKERQLTQCQAEAILEEGKYVEKIIPQTVCVLGEVKRILLSKEVKRNDDVKGKLKMLEEAMLTGDKIAADSDPGAQVWNGEIHAIQVETEYRSPDGEWERIKITTDATFGEGKVTRIINRLDASGQIIDSCEVEAGVDFFWKNRPHIAPFIKSRGNTLVNREMALRGVIETGAGMRMSLDLYQDVLDLVYLGLSFKEKKKVYSILHKGVRLAYENEEKWKKDIRRIKDYPNIKIKK